MCFIKLWLLFEGYVERTGDDAIARIVPYHDAGTGPHV